VTWETDKAWSDRFVPEIKSILGGVLIDAADPDDDALRNTDLITLTLRGGVRVACRIRKHHYLSKYGDEFTIRCSRPSGTETEIDKLLSGWGDYLFYGFADETESRLAAWLVGDLHVFRRWLHRYYQAYGESPGDMRRNHDGSSAFFAFGIYDVGRGFIVAQCERTRVPSEHAA
jgi:hypothetical protein